jgi:uncharacterized protein YjbI with pentapeptide repeats
MPAPINWEAVGITIGLAVLAVLLGRAVWWLWWQLPKREVAGLALKIRDARARADVEDNYRKTIGQALGSVVVLLGTGVALLGAGVAYLQFSQQQRAAHDLLISNQVSKGFEQLGSEKVVVRLGGIYALEGVMNNSDQYHQAVLEALCAFVREGAKLPTVPPTPGSPIQGPPTDIQAALTVIGRRSNGRGIVDLTKANISGAVLDHADLVDADLESTNLAGTFLFATVLSGSVLNHADLTGANLQSADLFSVALFNSTLTDAVLTGANLTDANLTDAILTGADLTKADLTGAEIDQKQLDVACGSDAKLPTGLTLKPCSVP